MGRTRVGSWDESFKRDRVAVAGIINQFYLQKSNLVGVNGLSTPDLLWRFIMIDTEMESLIVNYIEEDSDYFEKVTKLKKSFNPDFVKMPQNSGAVLADISEWERLLSKEFMKLNMMLTRARAARI